jgi:chitinase
LLSNEGFGGGTFGNPTGDPANTTTTTVGAAAGNNNMVQAQSFRNYTTGELIAGVNDNYRELPTNPGVIGGAGTPGNDSTGTGYMQTLFVMQNTTSVSAPWDAANWDPNFGSAPVMPWTDTSGTGVVTPGTIDIAFPQ